MIQNMSSLCSSTVLTCLIAIPLEHIVLITHLLCPHLWYPQDQGKGVHFCRQLTKRKCSDVRWMSLDHCLPFLSRGRVARWPSDHFGANLLAICEIPNSICLLSKRRMKTEEEREARATHATFCDQTAEGKNRLVQCPF